MVNNWQKIKKSLVQLAFKKSDFGYPFHTNENVIFFYSDSKKNQFYRGRGKNWQKSVSKKPLIEKKNFFLKLN